MRTEGTSRFGESRVFAMRKGFLAFFLGKRFQYLTWRDWSKSMRSCEIVNKTQAEGVLRVVPDTDEVQLGQGRKVRNMFEKGFCRHSSNHSSYFVVHFSLHLCFLHSFPDRSCWCGPLSRWGADSWIASGRLQRVVWQLAQNWFAGWFCIRPLASKWLDCPEHRVLIRINILRLWDIDLLGQLANQYFLLIFFLIAYWFEILIHFLIAYW